MSRRAFDDFDEFARGYREAHTECVKFSGADSDHFSEQKVEEIKRHETPEPKKILDLGCGDGNSAAFFRKHFTDSEYFGIDTSKESIAVAVERKIENASFAHYDGFVVPFEENTFDLVLIACVLHHIDHGQHERVLEQVKRVLKPGGRLYVFEHNPYNPLTRRVVNNCPFDADAVLLTSSYTARLLQKLGFAKTDIAFTIFFPRHRIFQTILPFERFLKWLPIGGQYFARSLKGTN